MRMIAAVLNTLYGIAAIDTANVFVAKCALRHRRSQHVGLVPGRSRRRAVLRRVRDLARRHLGRWFGVASASVNAILQMLWVPGYPVLALTILAIDITVIYGLLAYGGRRRAARERARVTSPS